MRRKLFNLAAALSLVLFVATVVLWVRSYHTIQFMRWQGVGERHDHLVDSSLPGRCRCTGGAGFVWQAARGRPIA